MIAGRFRRARPGGAPSTCADDSGFALASVLFYAILISLLASALMLVARGMANDSFLFTSELVARASTESGLNRMILAYAQRGDPLRELLVPDGRPLRWDFRGKTLLLQVQAESGKLDVNAADRAHIVALIGRLIEDPDARAHVLAQIDSGRSGGSRLTSIEALLRPFDRLTQRLDALEPHFTVMTSQRGFDPLSAPAAVIETTPGLSEDAKKALMSARNDRRPLPLSSIPAEVAQRFATERPIYTFRAETSTGFAHAHAIAAVVGFSERGEYVIYSWAPASMSRR
jgi:hypothetical protein